MNGYSLSQETRARALPVRVVRCPKGGQSTGVLQVRVHLEEMLSKVLGSFDVGQHLLDQLGFSIYFRPNPVAIDDHFFDSKSS